MEDILKLQEDANVFKVVSSICATYHQYLNISNVHVCLHTMSTKKALYLLNSPK